MTFAPVTGAVVDRTDVPSRSIGELVMYMQTHACPSCGSAETSTLVRSEQGALTRYAGACPGCGAHREFRFRTPPAVLAPRGGGLAPGTAPSQLFTRAQLEAIAEHALAAIGPADPLDDLAALTRVTAGLSIATTALVEADKFPGPPLAERVAEVRGRRDRVDARRRQADVDSGHVVVDRAAMRAHAQWLARRREGPGRLVTRGAVLTGAELRGMQLSAAQLTEVILDRANLSFSLLAEIELERCSAVAVNLMSADLARAKLRDCKLQRADLRLAVLRDARVDGGDWEGCAADRGGWNGAHFIGVNLRGSALDDVVLDGAVLEDCDLRGARLARVSPAATLMGSSRDVRLIGCDLRDVAIAGRAIGGAVLERCKVAGLSGQPVVTGAIRVIDCEGPAGRLHGGAEALGWRTS
jgi:uncharacterized protein YjbI with pentapeptide repeats